MTGFGLRLENLSAEAGSFRLTGISFEVESGKHLVILGPTGAGKTLLLEAIAGLRRPQSGRVFLGEREITHLPPERRDIGYLFQDYALFPHLTVWGNIAFGLRLRGLARSDVEHQVEDISRLLGIEGLLKRRIPGLSGGERQRVALARTLVLSPKLLLLDEPLAALDPETKSEVRQVIRRVQTMFSITTLQVTHDFEDAALGKKVAVLLRGKLAQLGSVDQVFRRPASPEVARFLGAKNILSGEISPAGTTFYSGKLKLAVVTELRGPAHAVVRPEDITLSSSPSPSSARNVLPGKIVEIESRGLVAYVRVEVPPLFTAAITQQSLRELGLREGMRVYLSFKASAVHVF